MPGAGHLSATTAMTVVEPQHITLDFVLDAATQAAAAKGRAGHRLLLLPVSGHTPYLNQLAIRWTAVKLANPGCSPFQFLR